MITVTSPGPKKLQVGVVGAGYFSQFHLLGWQGLTAAEVVAVCDEDLGKAQAAAKRFAAPHGFKDASEMLDQVPVDLLDIVTPPSTHAALVRLALKKRIPVICQKPFGASYAQALELVNAAETVGVPLIVHENFRFMPWYREVRRMIDAGMLGRLHGICFRLRPGDGQGSRAYLDRQPYFQLMPRLLVVETAVHFIDIFRYLMGEVTAVYARLRRLNPAIQGEDSAVIVFEFEGGEVGVFDGNRLNEHVADNPRRTMGEMWLEGEAGVLRLDGDGALWFKPHGQPEAPCRNDKGDPAAFGGGACAALQKHVTESLAAQVPPENCARAYLRNLLVQEAVYDSHATGRRIELEAFEPPKRTLSPQL